MPFSVGKTGLLLFPLKNPCQIFSFNLSKIPFTAGLLYGALLQRERKKYSFIDDSDEYFSNGTGLPLRTIERNMNALHKARLILRFTKNIKVKKGYKTVRRIKILKHNHDVSIFKKASKRNLKFLKEFGGLNVASANRRSLFFYTSLFKNNNINLVINNRYQKKNKAIANKEKVPKRKYGIVYEIDRLSKYPPKCTNKAGALTMEEFERFLKLAFRYGKPVKVFPQSQHV